MKNRFGRLFVVTGTTIHILWLLAGVLLAGRATILTVLGVGLLCYLGLWLKMKRVNPPIEATGKNAVVRFIRWHQEGLRGLDELTTTLLTVGFYVGWAVLFILVLSSYDAHLIAPLKAVDSSLVGLRTTLLALAGIGGPAIFFFGGRRLSH